MTLDLVRLLEGINPTPSPSPPSSGRPVCSQDIRPVIITLVIYIFTCFCFQYLNSNLQLPWEGHGEIDQCSKTIARLTYREDILNSR